nr:MAG TPA: hypothetical protein [Caudoviricetes sp.]
MPSESPSDGINAVIQSTVNPKLTVQLLSFI